MQIHKNHKSHDRLVIIGLAVILLDMTAATLRAQTLSDDILNSVRLDQRLGGTIPRDARFVNESGHDVELGEYLGNRPLVLVPMVYRCQMLCSQVLSAIVRTVAGQTLNPGEDFTVIVFSIDPRETRQLAVEKKLQYLERIPRPAARQGWHFLVGSEDSIRHLTDSLGYRYSYDAKHDQFAHPAAIAVVTPQGVISRYLAGLDYTPKDLHLALVEASSGTIGTFVDQVLLRCYCYDPERGRYGFAVMTALRIGGFLTVAVLGGSIYWMTRRHRAREREWAAAGHQLNETNL